MLGLPPPFALLLGAIALWLYTMRMPRHRVALLVEGYNAASDVALLHVLEGLIDLPQLQALRHHLI